jgi:hypothetical protein
MPVKIIGKKLPEDAYDLLRKGTTTAIISTKAPDGYPRTAPFGWITAKDRKTIRVGMSSQHRTYENISRDGKVMVCLIDEDNVSLGVKGDARIILDNLNTGSWTVSVVEITVLEVKSDSMENVPVIQGVRWFSTPEDHEFDLKVLEQLRTVTSNS